MPRFAVFLFCACALCCVPATRNEDELGEVKKLKYLTCAWEFDNQACAWPDPDWVASVKQNLSDCTIGVKIAIQHDQNSSTCDGLEFEGARALRFFEGYSYSSRQTALMHLDMLEGIIEENNTFINNTHTVHFRIPGRSIIMKAPQSDEPPELIRVDIGYKPKYKGWGCTNERWLPCQLPGQRLGRYTLWSGAIEDMNVTNFKPSARLHFMQHRAPTVIIAMSSGYSGFAKLNKTTVEVVRDLSGIVEFNVEFRDVMAKYDYPWKKIYSENDKNVVNISAYVLFSGHLSMNSTFANPRLFKLDTRSGSCQQQAWCERIKCYKCSFISRTGRNYRLNISRLHSAVNELYLQSNLTEDSYALVLFNVDATAETEQNPLVGKNSTSFAVQLKKPFQLNKEKSYRKGREIFVNVFKSILDSLKELYS